MTTTCQLVWDAKCAACGDTMKQGTYAQYSEETGVAMRHANGCPMQAERRIITHAYVRLSGTNYCANRDCGQPEFAAVHAYGDEDRQAAVADYVATTFGISDSAAWAHAGHILGLSAAGQVPQPTEIREIP